LLGRKLGSRLAQRHELAVDSLGWKRDAILALGIVVKAIGFAEEFRTAHLATESQRHSEFGTTAVAAWQTG
jgi:hypothetical protein